MISAKGSPVEKLAEVNNFLLEATNEGCLDYSYDKMIEEMSEINWDSEAGVGGRQWTYQTCTGKEISLLSKNMLKFWWFTILLI